MQLKKIKIQQFRNLKDIQLDFSKNVIVFEGANGQGKTNIVESIYFLSQGKSFRTPDLDHLIQKGKEYSFLEVELEKEDVENKIKASIQDTKKQLFINEKKSTSLKNYQKMPVILFSPESLSIIKEGPELRRNLIDETLIIKDAYNQKVIQNYRKILRTKNAILRQYKREEISQYKAKEILKSLNVLFLEHASSLVQKRLEVINEITPIFRGVFNEMTNQNVDISVAYVVSGEDQEDALKITNTMRNKIEQRIDIELSGGLSLVGPHKHDIVFRFDNQNSRYYCSQGQQRALILAFKLTQILYHRATYGYYPILILDDVLSELDKEKRGYLIEFLNRNKAQTFLTTTDFEKSEVLKNFDVQILKIKNGLIENH